MACVTEREAMGVDRGGDATARMTVITDALNQITRGTYDPVKGNLLTVTDPLNHTTNIIYNQFGQPISVTDALNHTTTFEYNQVGELIAIGDPLGNRTLGFYDAVSRLMALVDPRGKSTTFTYDHLNRVTEIHDAINGTTLLTYDPNGSLLSVTDAKNHTITYTYDNMDRLATRKDALNRTENYAYDVAANLITFTDRKGQVTTFQYDALNRRISATYADATTTFTYDTVGRLVKASDTAPGAGNIDFAYDILDRLIQETTGQGSVSYQYDVLGRRTQMTANGQQPTTYQYDAGSRLTRIEQGALFAALGYDNANRRTSLSYSNNTTTSYAYDLASRLTGITHNGPSGIIEALTYQYDAAGNRVGLTRGNGTASLLPNAVASATYDAANEQTAFAGATLQYDANGNLINDGTNTYQWDARNRLMSIAGGTTAAFNYDALGRRTIKTIGSLTSQFLYDGNDVSAEIGGGAVGANYLRSLSIDEPFVRQTSSGNEFYHTDPLGSALALSNAQGAPVTAYGYEPFGRASIAGTSTNPFQFTGRENDGTGLYYYRVRYYSPVMHRFIGEDLIDVRSGDPNLYGYANQNPILRSDPYGLMSTPMVLLSCILGAAGGAIGIDVKKPLHGAAIGGLVGCSLSLLVAIPPGPLGATLGTATGALAGAAVAGASSGGDPYSMLVGAAAGGAGGALGGALGGGTGLVAGTAAAITINSGYGLYNRALNTSVSSGPGFGR